jgi:hypothetical protein
MIPPPPEGAARKTPLHPGLDAARELLAANRSPLAANA